MSEYLVDIDESNAAQLLIEESSVRPVVVHFWSPRSEPCKELVPLLERIAEEYAGAFLLAKVNADEQGQIAQQFGVRNLPTVMVIQDGQPVDGFTGAQTEDQVRTLLAKYLPKPWDALVQQGEELLAAGDAAAALAPLRQAFVESNQQYDILLTYVRVLLENNRLDEADTILDGVRMADQDASYEQLRAQTLIKREAAKSPEVEALEAQLVDDPDNLDIMAQLALQYSSAGQHREAMDTLVTILSKDREHADGATRKSLLDTISSLGKGDPLAVEFQRKLYSLMY